AAPRAAPAPASRRLDGGSRSDRPPARVPSAPPPAPVRQTRARRAPAALAAAGRPSATATLPGPRHRRPRSTHPPRPASRTVAASSTLLLSQSSANRMFVATRAACGYRRRGCWPTRTALGQAAIVKVLNECTGDSCTEHFWVLDRRGRLGDLP